MVGVAPIETDGAVTTWFLEAECVDEITLPLIFGEGDKPLASARTIFCEIISIFARLAKVDSDGGRPRFLGGSDDDRRGLVDGRPGLRFDKLELTGFGLVLQLLLLPLLV